MRSNNGWKEVSKSNPCPLCDRPDWCYLSENQEAVVCGRSDALTLPPGWRYLKDAGDGRGIFALEKERERSAGVARSIPPFKPFSPARRSHTENERVSLAKLSGTPLDPPEPKTGRVPRWLIEEGVPEHATETRYYYSDRQWVSRFEWEDADHPKGHDKTIRQGHRTDDGKERWSKGDNQWLPYRFDEAIARGKDRWILAVEGEVCVEAARALGLVAITWQGTSWGDRELTDACTRLKEAGVKGIVLFPDHDAPGRKKAEKLEAAGSSVSFPVLVLDPIAVWPDIPPKGDLVDWVKREPIESREFIDRLERLAGNVRGKARSKAEERSASGSPSLPNTGARSKAGERSASDSPSLPKPTETERLKLEIQAYLQSPDIFDKVRLKGQICSSYRINNRDFELLCQTLEKQNSTPKTNSIGLLDFLEAGTDALEWIVPGILPKGETVILAALAKCGKTMLATDIAHAVLSGGSVIGESVGVKGRVLLVSSDESANSTRRRLRARGFDLLPEAADMRVMDHLDINDLSTLEKELDDFRPHLVIIDSLTSITRDSGISEKDAEFAKPIYKLKDLIGRYGASGILIHHQNKDKEAKGINRVSGSARIVAATWGVWQLLARDPNNEADTTRWLKVTPREGEAVTLALEINPKARWAEDGIFNFIGEFGDESGQKRTQGERVMELLRKFSPRGLEYSEIDACLGIGKSLYTVLDRLEDRRMIEKRRSTVDARRWVYCLPRCTTEEERTTEIDRVVNGDSPPPPFLSSEGGLIAESLTGDELEDSQHLVNTESTDIQHPDFVEEGENDCNHDAVVDSSDTEIIQQPTTEKGEREETRKVKFDRVLQVGDRIIDVITTLEGVIVSIEDGIATFTCREFGRMRRPVDYLVRA